MGVCYISRRGTKASDAVEQLGIYPIGNNGRPIGNVTVLDNVVNLNQYIFRNNTNVISVSLPENLQILDDYAFQNCTSLQLINIPDNVDTVPTYCFDGCTNITKATLSDNITSIKDYAFQNCVNLVELNISDNITSISIGSYAFKGCKFLNNTIVNKLASLNNVSTNIMSYTFSELSNITNIITYYAASYYFYKCTNLRKCVILHPFLSTGGFGSYVFNGCTSLTEVVLPDDAVLIDDNMFCNRNTLTNVNIPTSLITIGQYAFSATSIVSVAIPVTLKTLSDSAFQNCTQLKDVTIAENTAFTLGYRTFYGCTKLTNDSVHTIMEHYSTVSTYVFDGCLSLTNVVVSRFWSYMFNDCTNLIQAKSTKGENTGDYVFRGCTKLQECYITEGTAVIGTCIFNNCISLKTVYLPSSITKGTSSSLTSTSSSYYLFWNCTAIQDVQLGKDWNMSLRLNVSDNLTVESMIAMFANLKDNTDTTALTLTLGSVNLAKLTDEQKAVAINKNWTLA